MSVPAGTPANDEIARVAHAIWEAEGQPEGRDHEHWMRARQLVEEGRAEVEFPQAAAVPPDEDTEAPRPVQPGFEDTAPGMVPVMKDEPGGTAWRNPAVASQSSSPTCRIKQPRTRRGIQVRPAREIRTPRRRRMPRATSRSRVRMTLPGAPLATILNHLPQNHNQSLGGVKDPAGV